MLTTLFLYLVVGGIAGWLITAAWGFNIRRTVAIVTLAGALFVVLVYYIQSASEPVDVTHLLGLAIIYIIAANLGAVIAADVIGKRWIEASR